ncbi:MAG: hypothetical protein ACYSTX_02975 [Planctomycetota bacterium]
MRRFLFLFLIIQINPLLIAEVTFEVRKPDGITPYDCNEGVMVGVKLPIVVISDSNDFWSGGLFIEDQNRTYGFLEGRGYDPNRLLYDPNRSSYGIIPKIENWRGSHLADAGESARVTAWEDSLIQGYDLYTTEINDNNLVAGEWFVIDYNSKETGNSNIGFYNYDISWTEPQQYIELSNVPTRNLNKDPNHYVDFQDYAIFASKFGSSGCVSPDWCQGTDIDRDGDVDTNDFVYFVEYWLWYTPERSPRDLSPSIDELDTIPCPGDPNIIYSIVDINGVNEITIDINESIRLYVDLETTNQNDLFAFNIEIDISNVNLGEIDNTPKPGGTAEILAGPNRATFWDYWGYGSLQYEGMHFYARTTGNAFYDGHMVSFVYTAQNEGDVKLKLINLDSFNTAQKRVCPVLEEITVHQVDPYTQQMLGGEMSTMSTMSEETQEVPTADSDEFFDDLEKLLQANDEIKDVVSKKQLKEFLETIKSQYVE